MKYIFLLLLLFANSCQIAGKFAVNGAGGREAYNRTLHKANKEELLLNIVRIKYLDNPLFLRVGNITNQYTYRSIYNPSLNIPLNPNVKTLNLNTTAYWQNQPIIQYSPQDSGIFAQQLIRPMELIVLQELILSGWDISLLFKLAVQNFGKLSNTAEAGAYNAKDKAYCSFRKALKILHYFQKKRALTVGVVAEEKLSQLQISFPKEDEKSEQLKDLLKNNTELIDDRYVISLDLGFRKDGIVPRSVLACLHYLAKGVDIPSGDQYSVAKEEGHCKLDAFRIKSSYLKPLSTYVSIKYKDKWFYIDDSDISSKRTFVLLLQLYQLHVYGNEQNNGLLLSLPIR